MALNIRWSRPGFAVSGVYDLEALRDTKLNQALQLSDGDIDATLSPLAVAGRHEADDDRLRHGRELPALVNDSRELHALRAMPHAPGLLLPVVRANHFSILEHLTDPDGELTRAALDLASLCKMPGERRQGRTMKAKAEGEGVGRSVRRKEDDRYLRGKGEFVGDIRLAGMRELAFVRSPLAHARILTIRKPAGQEGNVFVAADLTGVKPIVANSGLPGFKPSAQPILAHEKVRHVGEAIAVCVAATRAEAEDLAAAVEVEFDELPAVVDMLAARAPGAPLVHEQWGDNVFLESRVEADLSRSRRRTGGGQAHAAHSAPMHVAARRPRRGRGL
jgi:hypothetical protein